MRKPPALPQDLGAVLLVDDQHVEDSGPQGPEDVGGLVTLADDANHGFDAAQVGEGQTDQSVAEVGRDQATLDVETVPKDVADGTLRPEPDHLLQGAAPAAHHGAGIVGAADADEGHVRIGRDLKAVRNGRFR